MSDFLRASAVASLSAFGTLRQAAAQMMGVPGMGMGGRMGRYFGAQTGWPTGLQLRAVEALPNGSTMEPVAPRATRTVTLQAGHGAQFQVVSRTVGGVPRAASCLAWLDTVNVPAGETVTIKTRQLIPGKRMVHCHILPHEDAGMMAVLAVYPA